MSSDSYNSSILSSLTDVCWLVFLWCIYQHSWQWSKGAQLCLFYTMEQRNKTKLYVSFSLTYENLNFNLETPVANLVIHLLLDIMIYWRHWQSTSPSCIQAGGWGSTTTSLRMMRCSLTCVTSTVTILMWTLVTWGCILQREIYRTDSLLGWCGGSW